MANCVNNFFTTVTSSYNLFVVQNFMSVMLATMLNRSPSKSTGTDNIPARSVKDAASILAQSILHIINLSFEQNTVPNDLKVQEWSHCQRKINCYVRNYRSVSVLCVKCEMVVNAQLEDYLMKKKLLFDFQSGFRSQFSTS